MTSKRRRWRFRIAQLGSALRSLYQYAGDMVAWWFESTQSPSGTSAPDYIGSSDIALVNSHCATFDGAGDSIDTGVLPAASGTVTVTCVVAIPGGGNTFMAGCNDAGYINRWNIGFNWSGNFIIEFGSGGNAGTTVYSNGDIVQVKWAWASGDHTIRVRPWTGGAWGSWETFTSARTGSVSTTNNLVIGASNANGSLEGRYAGRIWDFSIDGTDHWPLSEGSGTTIYNTIRATDGTLTTSDAAAFWVNTQDTFHRNLTYGWRESGAVKIPALTDKSAAADGNAITNPAGAFHNGCETKLDLPDGAAFTNARSAVTSAGLDPDAIDVSSLTQDANNEHYLMADVSDPDEVKNILAFQTAPSGGKLTAMQTLLNHT